MSKRESFLSRGDDDDDYWLSSDQLRKLKHVNVFDEIVDDDTIEDDPWSNDKDLFERPSLSPDVRTFTADTVRDGSSGSARYRVDVGKFASNTHSEDQLRGVSDVTHDVELLGLGVPLSRDVVDDVEQTQLRKMKPQSVANSPETVVLDMVLGEEYNFEQFKSQEDKLALLDAAIQTRDGNAIMAVLLFVKATLKRSIFNKAQQTRYSAVNHHTSFLNAHYDFTDLEDALCMSQRMEDAAILKYNLAVSKLKAVDRVKALQNCYRRHFEYEPSLANDAHYVKQHISLLERQLPIDDSDSKAIVEDTNPALVEIPRQINSLISLPLVSTVHYCCLYHYADPPNYLTSPHGIRDEYKMDDRQFLYFALKARALFHDYGAIEALLTARSWYGVKKLKSVIPWEKVVEILHGSSAPPEVLTKYLKRIEDEASRFQLACQYKCHKMAVDTLISMKDRRQLEKYMSETLLPGSLEYIFARDALNVASVKWKN